jgi:hypothetical protein
VAIEHSWRRSISDWESLFLGLGGEGWVGYLAKSMALMELFMKKLDSPIESICYVFLDWPGGEKGSLF